MNNKATAFLAFVLGATVGSFVTWRYTKDVYEKIAQEEIDSVKAVFSKREAEKGLKANEGDDYENGGGKADEKKIAEYDARLVKAGYKQHFEETIEKKEAKKVESTPYVISPEEFGEFEEYEQISLTYYADNILADENDDVIEDVDETVGVESLTHFGEYEDDSVFVRNDVRRCDYEILLDQRPYSQVYR